MKRWSVFKHENEHYRDSEIEFYVVFDFVLCGNKRPMRKALFRASFSKRVSHCYLHFDRGDGKSYSGKRGSLKA